MAAEVYGVHLYRYAAKSHLLLIIERLHRSTPDTWPIADESEHDRVHIESLQFLV